MQCVSTLHTINCITQDACNASLHGQQIKVAKGIIYGDQRYMNDGAPDLTNVFRSTLIRFNDPIPGAPS